MYTGGDLLFLYNSNKEKPDADMDMEAAETTTIDYKSSFANIEVFFLTPKTLA